MNSRIVFFGMVAGLIILIGLTGGALVMGDNLLQEKSKELLDLKVQSQVLEEQQESLTQAVRDIEEYAELESIARSIVPQDKDQVQTVREIIEIGQQSGITFSSISLPDSDLGTPDRSGGRSGSSSGSSGQGQGSPITQTRPVEGLNGVYQMEITVISDPTQPASYDGLIRFLTRLEQNRRTAQVQDISITPTDGGINFQFIINVYTRPSS